MPDTRAMPVPDGLVGERVDAALARLLGLSRTRAAEIAEAGGVQLDGKELGKSDRLSAGGWLEVAIPDVVPAQTIEVVAEPVPGMRIVYDDDDLVVIDKPVGVAAHPSPGWTGPTVVGRARGRRLPDLDVGCGGASGHRAPPGRRHVRA